MKYSILLLLSFTLINCSPADTENTDNEHKSEHGHEQGNSDNDGDGAAHWMSPKDTVVRNNPIKSDKDSISRGLALYKTNCVACHGEQARGDGPAGKALKPKPANLRQMSGKHPDGDFAWKISTGRGAMPPWKSVLSENQIWDLVNYIQSLAASKKAGTKNEHGDDHSH